jgi:hypothetical protein
MDANLKHVQVQEVTRFDGRGNPIKKTQYSYFLGNNGPFTDEFVEGADTTDAFNAAVAARVTKLQAVGALPTAGY